MRKETEVAVQVAASAIRLADAREGADEVTSKGGIDLVTNTDIMIEDLVRSELSTAFPEYAIVGEERGGSPSTDRPYWLVDPICGTRPYASDVPLYCTNIALVENNAVSLAAIGLGKNGETVFAERGNGAYVLNHGTEYPISVSDRSDTLWLSGKGKEAANLVRNAMLARQWYIWQFSSSIAYPYVATGRMAGLVHYSEHLSSVHTAAGCFVAEQAGAIVTDTDGNPWTLDNRSYILASTRAVYDKLRFLIEKSR